MSEIYNIQIQTWKKETEEYVVDVFFHDPVCDDWIFDEEWSKDCFISAEECTQYINFLQSKDGVEFIIQDIKIL